VERYVDCNSKDKKQFILFIGYFVIWSLRLATSNFFYAWVIMELLSWVMALWLHNYQIILTFLVWQRICGLIFLYGWLLLQRTWIVGVALLIKTGLPPFTPWVNNLKWGWWAWFIFLTAQKALPFLILITLPGMNIWCVLWPVFSLFLFYSRFNFYRIILISRVVDSSWILLRYKLSAFWTYFLVYRAVWLIWANLQKAFHNLRSGASSLFWVLLGLPPTVIFWLKMSVWIHLTLAVRWVLTVSSWAILVRYLVWHNLNFFQVAHRVRPNTKWSWMAIIVIPVISLI